MNFNRIKYNRCVRLRGRCIIFSLIQALRARSACSGSPVQSVQSKRAFQFSHQICINIALFFADCYSNIDKLEYCILDPVSNNHGSVFEMKTLASKKNCSQLM